MSKSPQGVVGAPSFPRAALVNPAFRRLQDFLLRNLKSNMLLFTHQETSTFYLVIGLKLKFSFASLLKGVLGKSITPQVHPAYHALEMGGTSFLCKCPLKDGKGFYTDSGLQKQNGRESFHERVKSTLRFYHFNLRLIIIIIYIFQDLKRNDAKTAAWRKF